MTWVKFHGDLCAGDKRGLARATRFVFLELALLARPTRGRIRLARGMSLADAVHDMLGGNRAEVETALAELTDPNVGMVTIEGADGARELVIPSWLKWNSVDVTAAKRNRDYRSKKKRERDGVAHREHDGSVTRNETAPLRQRDGGETDRVTLTEERREDQISPSGSTRARATLGSASGDACAEAFADAVREVVPTYTIAGTDRARLVELANSTHAPADVAGKVEWLARETRRWIAAKRDDAFERAQGWRPHRMLVWLNGGGAEGMQRTTGKQPASPDLLAELAGKTS